MAKTKLNPKQERFCQEYVIDCNGAQAAIRAGYSENSAKQQASELLTILDLQERVAELQQEVATLAQLSAAYVLTGLMEVHDRCMEKTAVTDDDGKVIEYTFNATGANRALELLGKHLKLFVDRTEHDVGPTLAEALKAMRGKRDG